MRRPLFPSQCNAARGGFSLIELMAVVSIISVLTLLATPKLKRYMVLAKMTELKLSLNKIMQPSDIYFAEVGCFPPLVSSGCALPSSGDNFEWLVGADLSTATSCLSNNSIGYAITDCRKARYISLIFTPAGMGTTQMYIQMAEGISPLRKVFYGSLSNCGQQGIEYTYFGDGKKTMTTDNTASLMANRNCF